MKPYQVWVLPKSGPWECVFTTDNPTEAIEYATTKISLSGVRRVEMRDLEGPLRAWDSSVVNSRTDPPSALTILEAEIANDRFDEDGP